MNILNIRNINVEEEIKKSIAEVREELSDLTDERTCMIYTSYMYQSLRKKSIMALIIDTYNDLELNYSHYYIMVPIDNKKCYIVDLTYQQFGYDKRFNDIYLKGYQLVNNDEYNNYLNNIRAVSRKNNQK